MSHSTIGATALASPRPHPRPSTSPRRHLEVAPTRAQRRARPKLVHAVVLLTGVVAVLLAQLGLSMAVADGAYQISSLQVEQRDLLRDSEALAENLESLQSPQFLASNAEALGMVASGSLPYIDVSTGAVSGRAGETGGSVLGRSGGEIGNVTLAGVPLVTASQTTPTETSSSSSQANGGLTVVGSNGDGAGASIAQTGAGESSSTSGTLPSPKTR
ncbi:MAG: hypothetical protein CMF56_00350 [Leifsonia sp.]|nr:hypothetical protein [Leifsonia sp.]|tara:strand:- start:47975 stop:48622 length:648 start_codon:yes stop_codon:yes gene_type:complete